MFDWLLSFWQGFKDFIAWIWTATWDTVVKWFSSVWGVVLSFCSFMAWLWDELNAIVNQLVSLVQTFAFPSVDVNSAGLTYYLNIANTFFPLQELFVFIVSWLTLVGVLTVYRLIKSWIPTLS